MTTVHACVVNNKVGDHSILQYNLGGSITLGKSKMNAQCPPTCVDVSHLEFCIIFKDLVIIQNFNGLFITFMKMHTLKERGHEVILKHLQSTILMGLGSSGIGSINTYSFTFIRTFNHIFSPLISFNFP